MSNLYVDSQVSICPKQKILVDSLTADAPLLAALPAIPASGHTENVYERLLRVVGGVSVELDAPLQAGIFESKLQKQSLTKISFKVQSGLDKIDRSGGETAIFSKQMTTLLRSTGAAMEASIISDVLLNHAVSEGNYIDCEGTADDVQSSILAVRWDENATVGLYSSQMAGQGKTFSIEALYGGGIYEDSDGITSKGMMVSTFFGIQVGDPASVNALCNIQLSGTPSLPSADDVDELLLSIKANPSNSMLINYLPMFQRGMVAGPLPSYRGMCR